MNRKDAVEIIDGKKKLLSENFQDRLNNDDGIELSEVVRYTNVYNKLDEKIDQINELSRYDIKSQYLESGDTCYNLENWQPGKYNILFVTGISGAGKTTLGIDLAKEFNCHRVELDYISLLYMRKTFERGNRDKFYNKLKAECPEAVQYIDENQIEELYYREKFSDTLDILSDFCEWFLSKYEGTDNLYIINGAVIPDIFSYNFFTYRPLILKDINLLKTILRRAHREFETDDKFFSKLTSGFKAFKKGLSKGYRDANNTFKNFRKDLNSSGAIIEAYGLISENTIFDRWYTPITESLTKENLQKYTDKMRKLSAETGEQRIARLTEDPRDKASYQKFVDGDTVRNNVDVTKLIDENTYLISDVHFGKYGKVYDNENIRLINSIPKDAVLIFLGDVSYAKEPCKEYVIDCFKRIKIPNRYLILGNHDCYSLDYYYDDLKFKGVYEVIYVPEKNWIFSHQPRDGFKKGLINFHGHVHSNEAKVDDFVKNISRKVNCWEGYCDDKIYTLGEWLDKNHIMEETFNVDPYRESEPITETTFKSKINDDFKAKGKKSLSDFDQHKIDSKFIDTYKDRYSMLKDIDKSEFGYYWTDNDNLVGYVMANDYGWITAIEVNKNYKGYSLGEQLLKFAMNKMGGNRLGVHDDNKVAIKLYKGMGFKEVPSSAINGSNEKHMIFMTTDKSVLKESVITEEKHDYTPYHKDHKQKKVDFKVKAMDINDPEAEEYVTQDKYLVEYRKNIKKDTGEVLVDVDNDKIIGFVWVGKAKYPGFITTLSVSKAYRGYGFGHRLLKDAINKYNAIDLVCAVKNKTAMEMYKRAGFVPIGYGEKGKSEYWMKLKSKLTKEDKILTESTDNISYSSSFKDVKEIVDTLTKEELSHICNGEFKNSPYIKYRKVVLVNGEPAAFVDAYSIPGEFKKDELALVIASKKKFRGKGLAKLAASELLKEVDRTKYKKIYWETTKSNKASSSLAKSFGFKQGENINKDDDNYVLSESVSISMPVLEADTISRNGRRYSASILSSTIRESKDASDLDDNFKKKSGYTFDLISVEDAIDDGLVEQNWNTDNKKGIVAVCKETRELAGFIYVNNSGNIGPLKVMKDYKGYGVSNKLMKYAIEKLGGKLLGVYEDNKVAINLYKKFGFEEVGDRVYKDGTRVIFMGKKG